MAVARGIIALAVTLGEQRGELLRESPCRFTLTCVAEPILTGHGIVRGVTADDEVFQRPAHQVGRVGENRAIASSVAVPLKPSPSI